MSRGTTRNSGIQSVCVPSPQFTETWVTPTTLTTTGGPSMSATSRRAELESTASEATITTTTTTAVSRRLTGQILSSRGDPPPSEVPRGLEGALRAMFWGLDRFQRSRMLHRYKEKFG